MSKKIGFLVAMLMMFVSVSFAHPWAGTRWYDDNLIIISDDYYQTGKAMFLMDTTSVYQTSEMVNKDDTKVTMYAIVYDADNLSNTATLKYWYYTNDYIGEYGYAFCFEDVNGNGNIHSTTINGECNLGYNFFHYMKDFIK